MQGQLAKEQSRGETLSAEVLHLSAKLQQLMQAYNGLTRTYAFVFFCFLNSNCFWSYIFHFFGW